MNIFARKDTITETSCQDVLKNILLIFNKIKVAYFNRKQVGF